MSEVVKFPGAPKTFAPSEELMWAKAECTDCDDGREVFGIVEARAWALGHVAKTGHVVALTLGYDVRDERWLERLPAGRRAEIEAVRRDPTAVLNEILDALKPTADPADPL